MDARLLRSRSKLFAAVLELAADRRAEDLTVTEVAERAGVHRSTFYEHADSPAALLREALESELDEVRERYLAGADLDLQHVPAALRDVTLAVLVHVQEHREIYRRGLAAGGTLHDFLSAHFQGSSRLLLDRGLLVAPEVDGMSAQAVGDAAVRYVADGTVGAIAVWLHRPGHPEPFLRALATLVPSWWTLAEPQPGTM